MHRYIIELGQISLSIDANFCAFRCIGKKHPFTRFRSPRLAVIYCCIKFAVKVTVCYEQPNGPYLVLLTLNCIIGAFERQKFNKHYAGI